MRYFDALPTSALLGDIAVPGDKSISHRAIMLASIAKGTTTISGFLDGEDCLSTIKAFRAMGVSIEGPLQQRVVVHGLGKYGLKAPQDAIDCGNSGTTIRLIAGLLAGQAFDTTLDGDESLRKRPMDRVVKPLTQMGAHLVSTEGRPPLYIEGGQALTGIQYELPLPSAQVKSSILLAGMYAEGETEVIECGHTRDHTERLLTSFSYPIQKTDNGVIISSEGECMATDVMVPGDMSSAAFFIVAATLIPGSDIVIRNVGINPTRTGIIDILQMMGADIKLFNRRLCGEEPVADIRIQYAPLEGIDIPTNLVPYAIDEFPALFVAASAANGYTRLQGAQELRVKESDRIAVMVQGLQALGVDAQALEDGALIQGSGFSDCPRGAEIDSFGDHRVAMAFCIAGALSLHGIRIMNTQAVDTSFPRFIDTAAKVHWNIKTKELHDAS